MPIGKKKSTAEVIAEIHRKETRLCASCGRYLRHTKKCPLRKESMEKFQYVCPHCCKNKCIYSKGQYGCNHPEVLQQIEQRKDEQKKKTFQRKDNFEQLKI